MVTPDKRPPKHPRKMPKDRTKMPRDSWLYLFPSAWRMIPLQYHPRHCSWCNSPYDIIDRTWFRCPKCDRPEVKHENRH